MEKLVEKFAGELQECRDLAIATRVFLEQHDALFSNHKNEERFRNLEHYEGELERIATAVFEENEMSYMEGIHQLGAAHMAFLAKADKWFK